MTDTADGISDEELFKIAGIDRGGKPAKAASNNYDGLSDDELFAIAGMENKGRKGEKPKASFGAYHLDKLKEGVSNGFALPGLLVDGVNAGLRPLVKAFGVDPKGLDRFGSDRLRQDTSRKLNVEGLEPEEEIYRYSGNVAKAAGEAIATAPAVMLAAPQKIAAGLTEAFSVVGQGLGGASGGDLFEEFGGDRETGEAVGAMVGGALPIASQGPANKLAVKTHSMLKKDGRETLLNNATASTLNKLVKTNPKAAESAKEAIQLSKEIPGFQPRLAQATDAAGLKSMEALRATTSPEMMESTANSLAKNKQAIDDYAASIFKKSPANLPRAVTTAHEMQAKNLNKRIDMIDKQRASLAEQFERQPNAKIGGRLREIRDKQMDLTYKAGKANFADVYATADKFKVKDSVDDIYRLVDDAVRSEGATFQDTSMPGVFGRILHQYGDKSAADDVALKLPANVAKSVKAERNVKKREVSFEELHSLMRRTNEEYRAAKLGTDGTKTRYLRILKEALDDKVKKFEGYEYGELAAKLKNANVFWRDKYKKVFKEGVGGLMDKSGRYGETTPDEDIVRRLIVKPGRDSSLDEFFAVVGDDKEAPELLRNGFLDIFAKEAVRDGEVVPSLSEGFFRHYAEALEKVPHIKAELSSADKANDALIARGQLLREQRPKVAKNTLAKLANTEDAEGLIEEAMKSRKRLITLSTQARKVPGGSDALAFSIAEHARKQKDPYQFMLDNQATLKPILNQINPGHYDSLMRIAKSSNIISRSVPPDTMSLSTSVAGIGKKIGTSVPSLLSQNRAASEGRVSREHVVASVLGKLMLKTSQVKAERLIDAALDDPDIAKTLSEITKYKNIPTAVTNKIKNHLFSLGLRVAADDEEDSPEPPNAYRNLFKDYKAPGDS